MTSNLCSLSSCFEHLFDFTFEAVELLEIVFCVFGVCNEDWKALEVSELLEPDFESLLSFVVSGLTHCV